MYVISFILNRSHIKFSPSFLIHSNDIIFIKKLMAKVPNGPESYYCVGKLGGLLIIISSSTLLWFLLYATC